MTQFGSDSSSATNSSGKSAADIAAMEKAISIFQETFAALENELGGVIVGMTEVIRMTLVSVFVGGHVLLEGVPGLGKTLLIKSLARALNVSFKRIQFTPDLMPSDITGTQVLTEDENGARRFVFKPGPLFANLVLADEINRATPKTQSALLEAMEERQVTVLDETYPLPQPFFVMATQNPVELEGTYPLPEAQLDRFLVKLLVASPSAKELKEILVRTTGSQNNEIRPVFDAESVAPHLGSLKRLIREVFVSEPLYDVLGRMLQALTPGTQFATDFVKRYVRFGPGPRGAQAVILCAKTLALCEGRMNASFEDLRASLLPTLRHRLILNFLAEADGVTADTILEQVSSAK